MSHLPTSTGDLSPGPNAIRFARIAKIVLFNVYFSLGAIILVFLIPFGSNFTPIRSELMQVDDHDIARMRPNMSREAYTHEPPPGFKFTYAPTIISTNRDGFRDRDHALTPAPGTFRIAFFGDSFIFGLSVGQEETLPSQTERLLNADGGNHYETMNFGIPGLNFQGMGIMTQAQGLKYHPDVAVYSFICDDVSTTDSISASKAHRELMRELPDSDLIRKVVNASVVPAKMARYNIDYRLISVFPPLYQKRIKIVLAYLSELAAQNGHDIVVVNYCGATNLQVALEDFNQEHGSHITLLTDFKPVLNEVDDHPTAACNEDIATRLVPILKNIEKRRLAEREGQARH